MKIRNTILVFIFCLFLWGPILMMGATAAHAPLPNWLTGKDAIYLEGTSTVSFKDNLNFEGFMNEQLQEGTEALLGNSIPLKMDALLGNAALQRSAIEASAGLFDVSELSTFFGSTIVYDRTHDALWQYPMRKTDTICEDLSQFGAQLANLAEHFPNTRFIFLVTDNSNNAAMNPITGQMRNTLTTHEAQTLLAEACAAASNVSVVDLASNSADEYFMHYYTTDHHWNGWGAIEAYECAVEALKPKENTNGTKGIVQDETETLLAPLSNLQSTENLADMHINGSLARDGLDLLNETVNEPQLPLPCITLEEGADIPPALQIADTSYPTTSIYETSQISQDDKAVPSSDKATVASSVTSNPEPNPRASFAKDKRAIFDFYQYWYGPVQDTTAFNKHAVFPDRSALIICDSFGTAFKWIVSTGYGQVTTLYDLHDERTNVTRLQKTLTEQNYDTVFLVARIQSYASQLDMFPDYFTCEYSVMTHSLQSQR